MTSRPTHLRDFLAPKSVNAKLAAANKADALKQMAAMAAADTGKECLAVFNTLWEREKLGTTGVGFGIAIPHGRVEGLDCVHGFFARLAEPIAFDSIDDKPVDLIFLLLAPESAGADHLHALAIVSRLLRDAKLCDRLRKAKNEADLHRVLCEAEAAEAA